MKKRLLYFCSFIPYINLSLAGFEMISIFDITSVGLNQYRLTGNLCSFIKSCESINYEEYDGVIFTNCCNSTQRLYDYVTYYYPNTFTYILDLPHVADNTYYYKTFFLAISKYFDIPIHDKNDVVQDNLISKENNKILVVSSSLHKNYIEELYLLFTNYQLKLETCWSIPRGDLLLQGETIVPCPRMMNYSHYFKDLINQIKAVIFITMQKCDQIMFTYPLIHELCETHQRKLLLIEEEYNEAVSERSKIRYEAFKECLALDREVV